MTMFYVTGLYKMDSFRDNNSFTLVNFSYWQGKELYTQLMEKLLSGIIDGPRFDKESSQIWRLNRDKKYSYEEMLEIDNEKLTELEGFLALIF